jgi:hypothetical protein
MSKRKLGLGLFALALLGTMALASSAQAVENSFTINGAAALHATVGAVQEGEGTLLVEKLNLEIKCATFEVKEGLILSGLDADAKLLYKECKAYEHKAPLAEIKTCHVSDVAGGKPELLHITASALLLPIEFGPEDYGILAENIHALINFLSGMGCPLPLKNEVTGEVCALIEEKPVKTNDTVRPLLLLSKAIQEACPKRLVLNGTEKVNHEKATVIDELRYGTNVAYIEAKAELFLTGAHTGMTLGVLLL